MSAILCTYELLQVSSMHILQGHCRFRLLIVATVRAQSSELAGIANCMH